jgi:hypothetical protein
MAMDVYAMRNGSLWDSTGLDSSDAQTAATLMMNCRRHDSGFRFACMLESRGKGIDSVGEFALAVKNVLGFSFSRGSSEAASGT